MGIFISLQNFIFSTVYLNIFADMKTSMNFIMNKLQTFQGSEGFSDTVIGRVFWYFDWQGFIQPDVWRWILLADFLLQRKFVLPKEKIFYKSQREFDVNEYAIWKNMDICLERKNS